MRLLLSIAAVFRELRQPNNDLLSSSYQKEILLNRLIDTVNSKYHRLPHLDKHSHKMSGISAGGGPVTSGEDA